jgi:hypothetical protein
MAGLFGGPDAPKYVTPSGTELVTQSKDGGLFGVFPGTPDYTTPSTPNGPPSTSPGTTPQAPGIEVSIRVPGLLHLQGSLWVPPWLKDSAPTLLPILLQLLRQRIEEELCRETPAPSTSGNDPRTCETAPEPTPIPRREETEGWYSRVWRPGEE